MVVDALPAAATRSTSNTALGGLLPTVFAGQAVGCQFCVAVQLMYCLACKQVQASVLGASSVVHVFLKQTLRTASVTLDCKVAPIMTFGTELCGRAHWSVVP
jgi:hypothetical protein